MSTFLPASNVALIVEGLCKAYDKTVAIRSVSFSVSRVR